MKFGAVLAFFDFGEKCRGRSCMQPFNWLYFRVWVADISTVVALDVFSTASLRARICSGVSCSWCLNALCCDGTVLLTQSQILNSHLSSYFIAYFCPNRWSKDQARRKNVWGCFVILQFVVTWKLYSIPESKKLSF